MSILSALDPASWIGAAVKGIVGSVTGLIDQYVVDKDKANELRATLETQLVNAMQETLRSQADIIVAEARGESWMQRNWRPTLMFFVMFLMFFDGVVVPLVNAFAAVQIPILEAWNAIPDKMWSLLMLGVGGYIAGRSGEKMMDRWKKHS